MFKSQQSQEVLPSNAFKWKPARWVVESQGRGELALAIREVANKMGGATYAASYLSTLSQAELHLVLKIPTKS